MGVRMRPAKTIPRPWGISDPTCGGRGIDGCTMYLAALEIMASGIGWETALLCLASLGSPA